MSVLIPKRSRTVEGIEEVVISLYARGMSVRDIELQIRDIYGYTISDATISNITSKIQAHITEWQSRPFSPIYFVVWMDGIVFKVRQNGKVINTHLLTPQMVNGHFFLILAYRYETIYSGRTIFSRIKN